MERGASNNSLASGTKRPELDGGTMNEGDWTGTKKSKKLHECQVAAGGGLRRSRKRSYEHGEDEIDDVSTEKLYKCNYWEDPAYAFKIEYFGLGLARSAAISNLCERLHREFEAMYGGSTKTAARSTWI